jgi:plasmid stabilization system protein ParE
VKVRVTKRAQAQIDRAVQWWDGNGDLALKAFDEDLAKAFLLLSVEPGVGARVLHARAEGVRRLHLARVRYHLYYRSRGTPNLSLNPDASPAALARRPLAAG